MTIDEMRGNVEPGNEGDASRTAPHPEPVADRDAEVKSLIDRLQRLQAEFENYRKRMVRDVATQVERAADQEILGFLPLHDLLDRALSTYAADADAALLAAGVEQIRGLFDHVLEKKGVSRIAAAGKRFDPSRHEAIASMASEQESGIILEELSPGYTRGDRILQPSRVTVSRGPESAAKEAP